MTVIRNNEPTASSSASTNPIEADNDESVNNLMTTTRKNTVMINDKGQAEMVSMSNLPVVLVDNDGDDIVLVPAKAAGVDEDEDLECNDTNRTATATAPLAEQAPFASPQSSSSCDHNHRYPKAFYCPITGELIKDPVVCPDGFSYERHAIQQQQQKLEPQPNQQPPKKQKQEENEDDSNKSATTTSTSLYYPNRALLSVMEETCQRQQQQQQPNNSFDPNASASSLLLRLQQNVQSTWNTFVESSHRSLTTTNNNNNMDPNVSSSSLGGGVAAVASPNATTTFPPLFEGYHCPITFHLMHDPVIDKEGNTYERVAIENWIRAHGHSPITRTNMTIEELYPNQAIRSLLEEETLKENVHPSILQWKEEPPPNPNDIELGGGILSTMTQNPQNPQNRPTPAIITRTTQEDPRDALRRRMIYNTMVILFAGLCLIGFVYFGSVFFLLLFIMTLTIAFSRSHNARHGNLSEESDG